MNKHLTDEQKEIEGLRYRVLLLTEILSQASLYFKATHDETKNMVMDHLKRDLIDTGFIEDEQTSIRAGI